MIGVVDIVSKNLIVIAQPYYTLGISIAAREGHADVFKFLLSVAPKHILNIDTISLLYTAIRQNYIKIVEILLKLTPNVNLDQVFSYAASYGQIPTLELILKTNPKFNISSSQERAFRFSVISNQYQTVSFLFKINPNINILVQNGEIFNHDLRGKTFSVILRHTKDKCLLLQFLIKKNEMKKVKKIINSHRYLLYCI